MRTGIGECEESGKCNVNVNVENVDNGKYGETKM